MLIVGKGVVEWVAKQTGEFNCFGTDIGIGWAKNGHEFNRYNTYAGLSLKEAFPEPVLVAGVAYANYNGVNVEAHIASDGSKKWLTRKFLWTIFDYPFNQLKVKRITVCVGEGNIPSRRFVEHLGFILEAELADAHPTGKLRIYRLYATECRFLQVRHEKLAA